jgi:CMP-N,N'-diacetyllegionaminic acid synthase
MIENAKVNLVLIPARAGSVGIRRKNLMKVNEKSLVYRAMNHALAIKSNRMLICISSDSQELLSASRTKSNSNDLTITSNSLDSEFSFNGKVVFHLRPSFLSDSSSSTWSLVYYLSEKLFSLFGIEVLNTLILQPTSPFRSFKELEYFRSILNNNLSEDTRIVSVKALGDVSPARMYTINSKGFLQPSVNSDPLEEFSPRQELVQHYARDGGYYCFANKALEISGPVSSSYHPYVRTFPWNINIDCIDDLVVAQSLPKDIYYEDPNEHQ